MFGSIYAAELQDMHFSVATFTIHIEKKGEKGPILIEKKKFLTSIAVLFSILRDLEQRNQEVTQLSS